MTCHSDAKTEWAYKSRELLAGLCPRESLITYGDYYDTLRPLCGWPQRSNGFWWCMNIAAPTLMETARLNKLFGEPLLPSLVRKAKPGMPIGDGYDGAVFERYGVIPEDLQAFARVEAGRCFPHFGQPR